MHPKMHGLRVLVESAIHKLAVYRDKPHTGCLLLVYGGVLAAGSLLI
ncbi:Uncharacterised protein [Cronobacter sakazakii]|nr:Uncharacterised protein [Cronobacter sakazakii]